MATVLRNDFAAASTGLVLPQQKRNLRQLHDWLIGENALPDSERVLALTNYQQGRFGRMPTHILVVTGARIAFTHDGGMRSIPIASLDTSRLGLRLGAGSGEITLVCRDGESLTFRRGMSIAMSETAEAIRGLAEIGSHTTRQPVSRPAAPSAPEPPAANLSADNAIARGRGDDIFQFADLVDAPLPISIVGNPGYGILAVWTLDENLSETSLLVNTSDPYKGTCVIGNQGPVGALKIQTSGPWEIGISDPGGLPTLDETPSGTGDMVVMIKSDLSATERGLVVQVQIGGSGIAAMWAWGAQPDLLVNEIAPYAGTVVIPPGTQYLTVTSSGSWQLSPR